MANRILLGMSGGVDSSVAAHLLMEQGYEVCGVTMKLFDNRQLGIDADSGCCSLNDVNDARRVAYQLGIDHHVLGFSGIFYDHVISRFADGYRQGITPNPCIDCNRFVRFPMLLQKAELLGHDLIATGHYARVERDLETGRFLLKRAKDRSKDQSYVLYAMTQQQLAHTIFPLGSYCKTEIRAIARTLQLDTASKPDSQDICFIKDGDYASFLTEVMEVPSPEGALVTADGTEVGRHRGCIHYTIGQRRGLGLASPHPLYVTGKNMAAATVTVGEEQALYSGSLTAGKLNWISIESLREPMRVSAKIRYGKQEAAATVYPEAAGGVRVQFDQPQRAISPGQAAVFYDGDTVVGGGTILA